MDRSQSHALQGDTPLHPRHMQRLDHAVVIGGSISGMLAARILCKHVARVTVLERDALPEGPQFRAGAPQGRHPHILPVRGQQILEELFPGLTAELLAQGAILVNVGQELALIIGGTAVPPFASPLSGILCSRPLLEHAIYRRLAQMPQVRFLTQRRVVGLLTDSANRRAVGVRLEARGPGQAPPEELLADLVVDASGRSSGLPEWLRERGFPPPEETSVDAQAGYATRLYRRPAQTDGWKALYAMPLAPALSRGGILMPVEGDRLMATLIGLNGDHPPTDPAGFLAFAASVPAPALRAALAQAEPLGEPYGYRRAANRLRHYEALPRYLEGVLALGDSVYALNPVYGQGMTVAALGALTLDACLEEQRRRHAAEGLRGLARRFQRRLAQVNADPWKLATGQDLRWEAAAGPRAAPADRLAQAYFDRVLLAMTVNGEVAARFAEVQNMLRSPAGLFHPRLVWQVLRDSARARARMRPVGGPAQPAEAPGPSAANG